MDLIDDEIRLVMQHLPLKQRLLLACANRRFRQISLDTKIRRLNLSVILQPKIGHSEPPSPSHLQVYQRAGLPCYRCGTSIERIVVGGRGTHLCPRCQVAAAATMALGC